MTSAEYPNDKRFLEILERKIREFMIDVAVDQESDDPFFTICPRCGHNLHPQMVMNAVSRREDIYICSNCGADEAVKDFRKEGPLQITEWAIRGSVIDDAHYEWLTGGAIE